MAERLGVPVAYTWYPNALGFVRNTLRAGRCDLIMGVVAADELVQNTNPYYRSAYVLAYRSADADRFADLDSPLMQLARIGVVAGTPPADLLVRKGLAGQVRGLPADGRHPRRAAGTRGDRGSGPAARSTRPCCGGRSPATGPSGSRCRSSSVPLKSDPRTGLRLDFRISMGMRANEPEWKHAVNDLIRELQPQIQAILLDYGVPLLDEQGRPITAEPGAEPPVAASTVPEPDGYRMDRYRAAVPATLKGATVLSTAALQRLIAERSRCWSTSCRRPAKAKDRDQAQLWLEPKRENLPGSVWLPNVGYGELTPEFAGLFPHRAGAAHRRRQGAAGGVLLRQQLLDVVERRQAGDGGAGLHRASTGTRKASRAGSGRGRNWWRPRRSRCRTSCSTDRCCGASWLTRGRASQPLALGLCRTATASRSRLAARIQPRPAAPRIRWRSARDR